MAKPQNSKELKKRKRVSGSKGEEQGPKSNPKKFKKLNSSNVSQKGSRKQPFKPAKDHPSKPHEAKPHFNKDDPAAKRHRRVQAKELTEARKKKRKKHYTLEQELSMLWEKMRRRDITKEDRSKLVSEALNKMKGKIPEIASSHVSSRVLQTCVKHCSPDERSSVFDELRPHLINLAMNTYAVHLVTKMLDNASKEQLASFISSLHGHVAPLLRHTVGSLVIEHAYYVGNAKQKQILLMELYSTELRLFKDLASISETRLVDVISKLKLQKSTVLRHMSTVLQPILEKGILDHSIIHKALMEYLTIADKSSAADVIQQLSGALLVRMIHTRDGSRLGMLCIKHGSAKRKLPGFFDRKVYDILDSGGAARGKSIIDSVRADAAKELDLALASSTVAAAVEGKDADTAGPDDGLFSDFEQSVLGEVGGISDKEFQPAKEISLTIVQALVPISE